MKQKTLLITLAVTIILTTGCSMNNFLADKPVREMDNLPLVLAEDFDNPEADRWEPTDPNAWKYTTDGKRTVYSQFRLSKYEPPFRSPYNMTLLKNVYVTDFVMDLRLKMTQPLDNPHRDMCLFFGYQDPSHFYYAHLGMKADSTAHTIHIVNGAPRTSIVEKRTEGTPWTDEYHHVRVVRRIASGKIEVYFDDMEKPVMTASDKTFQWGRVGVGTFDDTGNVDKVTLWGSQIAPPK
jgi:hypothetical protein